MELREYVGILRRRWVSVALVAFLTVAATAVATIQTTPQYESSAQLFISTRSADSSDAYQGSLFSTQRVASYAETVKNEQVAQRVIDSLDLDITTDDLSQKVSATVRPDTVILDITVQDPDPEQAQELTQAYTVAMQQVVAEYETPPGRAQPTLQAKISDPATLPESPVSPKPVRNVGLGLMLGLLLGFAQAVVREMLDNTVKGERDVAATIGAPVMATVANDPQITKQPLISGLSSHEPRVETFRVLRTNLRFVDVDHRESKAFVVTSPLPEEGKTTTAVNAAIAMSQADQRVLIIEGDLRRPQIGRMLELDTAIGLTTVLVGQVSAQDAVQSHAPSGLDVLTSGTVPPNPAELLQSNAMQQLLVQLREMYDVVVIDAPPLLPVTDAALIASQVDGALIVVRHGKTSRSQLADSLNRLSAVGARTIGAVVNMAPKRGGGRSYGYGYGYGYGYAPTEPASRPRE